MTRKALGKGLDALLKQSQEILNPSSEGKQENSGASVQKLDITKVVPNPFQPRRVFNEEKLQELASSIKQHGLTQPVVVVYNAGQDKYELVVGERRFRASKIAGLTEIDAIVHKNLSDKEMAVLALIENIQREDLNPIETALGYRNLISKYGIKQQDLADFFGKNKTTISNSLRLLDLEPNIQTSIEEGKITEGHGRAILMLANTADREALLGKIVKANASVRQAETWAKEMLAPKEKKAKAKDADVAAEENKLQEALGTKVEIKCNASGKKGTLVLHFNSLDQLENITQRLKHSIL
ncbi:chromosome partitioning protein [Parelusimicrobium proximum]|uniref:ParB/RepB/Spo0J family partition protein n=1 Tax=Parelusimicrobium proximum TaxID=3228953 RepID=UPI003D186389